MAIYKSYTRQALDRQYNNRLQVPGYATHLDRWELLSRQTEKKYSVIKNVAYGDLPRELMDIYPSFRSKSKTLIFIHGGYWQKFDKSSFHFVAGAFHTYNITTVLLNYPLAPDASMDQIVVSCRKAIQWLNHNLSSFNGDVNELYIGGHSAGGHLVAMLMTSDLSVNHNSNLGLFKGACAISGLYNLVPIQLSDVNEGLHMDAAMALRNSPVHLIPMTQCPLVLAVGEEETNEFKDQSDEFNTQWKENIPVQLSILPGLNHFSILETLYDPTSALHKSVCQLMKI